MSEDVERPHGASSQMHPDDHSNRHRRMYEMRLQREMQEDVERADQTVARRLRDSESESENPRQHEQPRASISETLEEVRQPMATGYVDRLIDDAVDRARTARGSGILSWLWAGREDESDRSLPLVAPIVRSPNDSRPATTTRNLCARGKDAIVSFTSRYGRIILSLIIILLFICLAVLAK
jgi:hypothetical protein